MRECSCIIVIGLTVTYFLAYFWILSLPNWPLNRTTLKRTFSENRVVSYSSIPEWSRVLQVSHHRPYSIWPLSQLECFVVYRRLQVTISAIHLEPILLIVVPLSLFWLYSFFWVIPRRLNFMFRRFGTLCLFHLHRPMNTEKTECSETSAYMIQAPGNHPKERIQYSQHGESLKSRIFIL